MSAWRKPTVKKVVWDRLRHYEIHSELDQIEKYFKKIRQAVLKVKPGSAFNLYHLRAYVRRYKQEFHS